MMLCLNSCSLLKNKDVKTGDVNPNLEEFKIVFFQNCLSRSLKNEALFANDLSFGHDLSLGIKSYKVLDSLSNRINEEIILDSISWKNEMCNNCDIAEIERMNKEGLLGKRILKYCLEYYKSFELDSIARVNTK